jgi:hypothetical protein
MNTEKTPNLLDLEDPIIRALGVAASIHGCTEDSFNLEGLHGATQVLYDELRQIRALFYAICKARQALSESSGVDFDEARYSRARSNLSVLAGGMLARSGEQVCSAELHDCLSGILDELDASVRI